MFSWKMDAAAALLENKNQFPRDKIEETLSVASELKVLLECKDY